MILREYDSKIFINEIIREVWMLEEFILLVAKFMWHRDRVNVIVFPTLIYIYRWKIFLQK